MITINRLQQQRGESAFLFFFFPLGFSSREAFLFTNKFSFIYNFFFIFVQIIKLNIFTQWEKYLDEYHLVSASSQKVICWSSLRVENRTKREIIVSQILVV